MGCSTSSTICTNITTRAIPFYRQFASKLLSKSDIDRLEIFLEYCGEFVFFQGDCYGKSELAYLIRSHFANYHYKPFSSVVLDTDYVLNFSQTLLCTDYPDESPVIFAHWELLHMNLDNSKNNVIIYTNTEMELPYPTIQFTKPCPWDQTFKDVDLDASLDQNRFVYIYTITAHNVIQCVQRIFRKKLRRRARKILSEVLGQNNVLISPLISIIQCYV